MCGICGIWDATDLPGDSHAWLERMTDRLQHRGPDDSGIHIEKNCGLGHTRLSIIDLQGSRQPLHNEDRSVSVVYNGEIYNYAELRTWLIERGHNLQSDGDSEVLVHLWEELGPVMVHRLRGMFAFAIFDRNQQTLFAARDRFGQKPFFYHATDNRLCFASEIKALLHLPFVARDLDPVAVDQFLFYQFVPHPRTLFASIRQLPPAHSLLINQRGMQISRYWQPDAEIEPANENQDWLSIIDEAIAEAVKSHMVADVPVGLFLSGGIDSSLIAGYAARHATEPLKTFSIGFPGTRYDESEYARLASRHFGTEHREFAFEPHDLTAQLETVVRTFDQPIADRAALPLMLLSQRTSEHVKVVLTGDGGDELFAGYEKYKAARQQPHWLRLLNKSHPQLFSSSQLARCQPDRTGLRKLRSRVAQQLMSEKRCSYFKHFWEGWDRHALYQPEFRERVDSQFRAIDAELADTLPQDPLNRMLRIDKESYLPDDLLLKTDYATMAYGLESRAPFLDHHLAATAARLPREWKATQTETKVALRRLADRMLPHELVHRKKRGFGVPLKQWFQSDLADWTRTCLVDEGATVSKLFRPEVVDRVLTEHQTGQQNHASKIFSLMIFELWYREYMSAT